MKADNGLHQITQLFVRQFPPLLIVGQPDQRIKSIERLDAVRKFCPVATDVAGLPERRCAGIKFCRNFSAEFVGLTLPNRYVFGFGMDVRGAWRNLPAIYAVKE